MAERKRLQQVQVDCPCIFEVWVEGEGVNAIYPSMHRVHPDCRSHQGLLHNPEDGMPTRAMRRAKKTHN